jgi:prepilin-type N-terminal cleavage/methylation domain-containing protein
MRLNQRAFTLIEMMVVVGLIGVVILGSMRLFSDVFRTQSTAEASQDLVLLLDNMSRLLGDAGTCGVLLKGTVSQDNTSLVLGSRFYAGAKFGKLQVESLSLKDIQEITPEVRMAAVDVVVSQPTGGVNRRQIPVLYRVNKMQQIDSCLGDEISVKGSCRGLGGTWDSENNRCDFCGSLGGISDSSGACSLAGTRRASCPMQKAFGASGQGKLCSNWDSDFVSDALEFLGSFTYLETETLPNFRADMDKLMEAASKNESEKFLGSGGKASWILSLDTPPQGSDRPCQALVVFNVQCP